MTPGDPRLAHLRNLEPHLRSRLRGQDHVIAPVAAALLDAELGLSPPGRPKASFLLVGPTGTGKTELALAFTDYLYGRDRLLRFDLSEYQGDIALAKLLGSSPTDPGLLGRALSATPSGTLLFDELEKAHPHISDTFLQILDAGRITVATGRTFTLDPYVVVFTSNLGSAEAIRMGRSSWSALESATLRRVSQSLRPELVNRFTEKLVFRRLSPETQREICELLVTQELTRLRTLGHELTVTPAVIDFLVRHGFDAEHGARPLRRLVERQLQRAVTHSLCKQGFASGSLTVDTATEALALTCAC